MNKALSSAQHQNFASRRSQRRINKLLDQNICEYEIPNPYRTNKSNRHLPSRLGKQLSKIDFLSVKSLQNLNFADPATHEEVNEMLLKMREAVEKQAEQLRVYIYQVSQKPQKNSQKTRNDEACQSSSEDPQELHSSKFLPNQDSVELLEEQQERNLPLVSRSSEGASLMSDNYESDMLIFQMNEHLEHHGKQMEEVLQSYQI